MKKVAITVLIVALFCPSLLFAQEITPRKRVETMFVAFEPGAIDIAIEAFAKDSLIRPELVDSLQSQVSIDLTADNPILGYEFIQEQNVGQSVKRLTYILKTTKEPFVWNFSFYKPTTEWMPLGITFTREY